MSEPSARAKALVDAYEIAAGEQADGDPLPVRGSPKTREAALMKAKASLFDYIAKLEAVVDAASPVGHSCGSRVLAVHCPGCNQEDALEIALSALDADGG